MNNEPNLIDKLYEKNEALQKQLAAAQNNADNWRLQCDDLQADLAAARADAGAIRELMNCYNVGGWTDAKGPIHRALVAEKDLAAARALLREAAEEMRGQRQCESLVLDIDAALAGEKK